MSSARRPAPPPLEANDLVVTAVITAGWAVALIVVLALRAHIPVSDRWWIWTCVTGLGLGLFGLLYVPHLKRSRERAARDRAPAVSGGPPGAAPGGAPGAASGGRPGAASGGRPGTGPRGRPGTGPGGTPGTSPRGRPGSGPGGRPGTGNGGAPGTGNGDGGTAGK